MVEEIFDSLEASFIPGAIQQPVTFYYTMEEVKKTVTLGPDFCRVDDGKAVEEADCVCKTTPEFFQKVWNEGYIPGMKDFLSGAIKSNDPQLLKVFLAAFGK